MVNAKVRTRFRSRRYSVCLLLAIAFAAVTMPGVASGAAEPRNPVIFVHGWKENGAIWGQMISDFQADGYPPEHLYAWNYDTSQSNETTAQQFIKVVDDVLARTGASKVDVVTHSMGGLNTRWYLKFLDGTAKVDDWVSLGGPNHGTKLADQQLCGLEPACNEMQTDSQFLTTLNEGDETPGVTNYGTWWSPCDEFVIPQQSTILSGATNTQTACIEHIGLVSDPTVSQQVRAFVR